jgi:hypothetical protein
VATAGDEEVRIVLDYWEQSDLFRNVMTAGSAGLVNRRIRYALTKPRILDASSKPCGTFRAWAQPVLKLVDAAVSVRGCCGGGGNSRSMAVAR